MKDGNARLRYNDPMRILKPTARHLEILKCAANGMGWRETADALGIAPQTVKNHRAALFERLGAANIAQAVYIAVKSGLLA